MTKLKTHYENIIETHIQPYTTVKNKQESIVICKIHK